MPFKRLILIATSLFTLSCHQAPKPEITTSFDTEFEILHGRVKQLSEAYKDNEYGKPETHVTDFDIHGNAIETTSRGDCNCLVKYEYQYDKTGKKNAVIVRNNERLFPFKYKYDASGRIAQFSVDTKELQDDPASNMPKQEKGFYKYDTAGDMVRRDGYLDTLHQSMGKYRYNSQHVLIQADEFYQVRMNNKGPDLLNKRQQPDEKIIYQYEVFDAKGNWLKRMVVKHINPNTYFGPKPKESVETDIEVRKITYY
jgi:hypothetical protein